MSVAQVRTIVNDKAQHDRATATGDGASTLFEMPHGPVLTGTITVTNAGTAQTDPTHYSIDLDLGLITFVSAPSDGNALVFTYQHTLISDDDITTFLSLEASNVKRAAAATLETIARNRALIEKKIKLGDLETDGVALAAELRLSAKQLRDEDRENSDSTAFAVAEMNVGPLWRREKLEKLAEKASS